MKQPDNINRTLLNYVKDTTKWFYWYHSPERLEALYKDDHKGNEDYKKDKLGFTKKVWRFKRKPIEGVEIEENLADFFDAVLDEVRLKKANSFAKYALYISDNDDLAYFRDTVAKREISADIDYNKQRDHAVHTLYNYLVGWYIFEHSEKLREEFRSHFKDKLDIDLDKQNKNLLDFYKSDDFGRICKIKIPELNNGLIGLVHEFADVWSIASLLHDIGYILEGGLSSASPEVEHLRVANGSKIIHDYFNHYFWQSFEVDFRVAKNIAKTLGVAVPDFRYSRSLASLGDHLCDIGSCENIRKDILNRHGSELCNQNDQSTTTYESILSISEDYGLNREAFSIWKEHYKRHGNEKMADILYVVERVYKNMMWVGDDHGKRNLDHGVCSGLITLQALTFFHELFWGFCLTKWSPPEPKEDPEISFSEKQKKQPLENTCDRVSKELFNRIKNEITLVPKRIRVRGECDSNDRLDHDRHCKLRSDFWFKKILWATASSAIHSIIQKPEFETQCKIHKKEGAHLKIGLKDDPLAFLGVLVDKLQEWDRYTVAGKLGEAAFSDSKLLQSTEVQIGLIPSDMIHCKASREGVFSNTKLLLRTDINVDFIHSSTIYLTYPNDWAKDLKEKMNKCLEDGWEKIVEILPNSLS